MRIIFICSSMEPGCDGVGDYTRRLACQLIRNGHQASVVALNDSYCERHDPPAQEYSDVMGTEVQCSEGINLKVLRLPSSMAWSKRTEMARNFVKNERSELLSLQYVPFSFHTRGLSPKLPMRLLSIGENCRWHVMIHELWIDSRPPFPLRQKILGVLQKPLVLHMLARLSPIVIHTQLQYHRRLLKECLLNSAILPLHGSIPRSSNREAGRRWLYRQIGRDDAEPVLIMGFFGNLYDSLDFVKLHWLVHNAQKTADSLYLCSAGKLSLNGALIWAEVERQMQGICEVEMLGELDNNDASLYLSSLDIGLTSYSFQFANKSSAVAAMHEHCVPVLAAGTFDMSEAEDSNDEVTAPELGNGINQVQSNAIALVESLSKEHPSRYESEMRSKDTI